MSALSASVVAAIEDLELAARLVVEGLRAGGHLSPFHGFSAEFQQHRPYRAGDDLKYLDWKVLARTDRFYTRQFRETTSMSAMLVLDTSASMAFPADGVSKARYAAVVAASLAYLVATQGDAIGIMSMAGSQLSYLPARGGRLHLTSLISRIDQLETAAEWDGPRVIARAAELLKRRGAVVVISDFYDAEEATARELRRVARMGHDVSMLQVISPAETDFSFRGEVEFVDLESGVRRLADPVAIATTYRTAVRDFLDRTRSDAQRHGFDYALMSTGEPPEVVLRKYLLARGSQRHSGQAARQQLR